MNKLNLPAPVVVVLGLIAGVLEYLNQASFSFGQPWKDVITFGLYAIAIVGVSPLVHAAFRSALHLPIGVATAVTTGATLLAAALTTFSWSAEAKGIAQAILAFAAFAGFAAGPVPTTPVAGNAGKT